MQKDSVEENPKKKGRQKKRTINFQNKEVATCSTVEHKRFLSNQILFILLAGIIFGIMFRTAISEDGFNRDSGKKIGSYKNENIGKSECSGLDTKKSDGCGDSSGLILRYGSKQSINENFITIKPEKVKCDGWISVLSFQMKTILNHCSNPERLFSKQTRNKGRKMAF